MEEKERTTTGSMSRGVSTGWNTSAGLSSGRVDPLSPGLEQSFYRTETAPSGTPLVPRTAGHDTRSVGSRYARLNSGQLGQSSHGQHRSHFEQSSRGLGTSTSDAYMTDDVHVRYNAPASSPHTHTMTGAQSSHGGSRRGLSTRLSPRHAGQQDTRPSDPEDQPNDYDQGMVYGAIDTPFSSSYPSNAPFLPPPPPSVPPSFDPTAVMFPGPGAIDGGIRIVPPHSHGDVTQGGMYDGFTTAASNFDDCWKRHTRVYGGGVCLACAGRGGVYGATVRPEDRR